MSDTCGRCSRELNDREPAHVHGDEVLCALCMMADAQSRKPAVHNTGSVTQGLSRAWKSVTATPGKPGSGRHTLSNANDNVVVPEYRVLKAMAGLIEAGGWLTCLLSVIVLISALHTSATSYDKLMTRGTIVAGLTLAGGMIVSGLFSVAFAQLLYCVRDVARNSFNK